MNSPAEAEQALWRRLAVFGGRFSLEAAEAVCAGECIETGDVPDLLAQLVSQSLVVAEGQEVKARYRLPETLHREARERLKANGERDTLHERLAAYYLALVEQARREWFDTRRAAWLERLGGEHENLRATLRWLAERGEEEAEQGLRLAGFLLRDYWTVGGRLSEGREWLAEFLALPQAARCTATRARALDAACVLAAYQGDNAAACCLGEESAATWRAVGDRKGLVYSLLHLGSVTWLGEKDDSTARALFEEGLAICREADDRFGIASSAGCLGNLALDLGDYPAARSLYRESMAIFREREHVWGMSVMLENFAGLAAGLGHPERALRLAGAGAAHREVMGIQLPPDVQARLERLLKPARQALDEVAQASAWEEGRAMTLKQSVTYALEEAASDAPAQ